jgi:hypothetical protein
MRACESFQQIFSHCFGRRFGRECVANATMLRRFRRIPLPSRRIAPVQQPFSNHSSNKQHCGSAGAPTDSIASQAKQMLSTSAFQVGRSQLGCSSLTRTVIPAERAGLCSASESRNPVNDTVSGLTEDVVYWVPARARPLGRARLAGTTARCDRPVLKARYAPPQDCCSQGISALLGLAHATHGMGGEPCVPSSQP